MTEFMNALRTDLEQMADEDLLSTLIEILDTAHSALLELPSQICEWLAALDKEQQMMLNRTVLEPLSDGFYHAINLINATKLFYDRGMIPNMHITVVAKEVE